MPSPLIPRPTAALNAFTKRYPGAWSKVNEFVIEKGKNGLPDWPAWCFAPMAASYAVISSELGVATLPLGSVLDVAKHAALCAWRVTQGIYRFDPAVFEAVRDTPIAGDIPHQILYNLPEWCVYVETPGMTLGQVALHGAFVHLEHDANTLRPELRFLLDTGDHLVAVSLHLGAWSLDESIRRMSDEATLQAARHGLVGHDGSPVGLAALRAVVEPLVSMVLYVCSQAGEITGAGDRRPTNPGPVHTKRGPQIFPAPRPTTWDVGVRLGAALRRAYHAQELAGDPARPGVLPSTSPRPHIRRAHWHGFRLGPRTNDDGTEIPTGDRLFELRWMPPIAVNLGDGGEIVPTIRPVR